VSGAPRVLVTGAAGFIGGHVVAALQSAGASVRVVDLKPFSRPGVESVQGDLTDPAVVERALEPGFDAVVHLAAATSVLLSVQRPALTTATNVTATASLLERSREVGVKSFVFASTNAVAGPVPVGTPINEKIVLRPLTPYGATKAAAEMLMTAYTASYGVRCVALRFTNVYGPGMTGKDSIVARLMKAAVAGEGLTVYGAGQQVRDYVYVEDVVAAVQLGLANEALDGPLTIGASSSYTVLEVLELARAATGAPLPAHHVEAPSGEMPRVVVDTSRATEHGWSAKVDLAEGLRSVWESWPKDVVTLEAPVGAGQA
jgi:UDP-glucose 4-epimerase